MYHDLCTAMEHDDGRECKIPVRRRLLLQRGSLMLQGMTWKGSPFEALSGMSALATTGGYRGAHCCCCCPLGWKLRAVTYFPLDHQHYVGPD